MWKPFNTKSKDWISFFYLDSGKHSPASNLSYTNPNPFASWELFWRCGSVKESSFTLGKSALPSWCCQFGRNLFYLYVGISSQLTVNYFLLFILTAEELRQPYAFGSQFTPTKLNAFKE